MIANDLARAIAEKKAILDKSRPLWGPALEALEHYLDVELTYTSNAIEGNTLTHSETALVIETGITIGGKTVSEHLEAQDLHAAVRFMRELAAARRPLGEGDVTELHRRVVLRSRPEIAGIHARLPRRVAGSAHVFPNAAKAPDLMATFGAWLSTAPDAYEVACEAHYRLVAIHPFSDGNGRTAQLLMNLILLRGGYPPIAIRPADRKAYIDALERAHLRSDFGPFCGLLAQCLDDTLGEYIAACRQTEPS